MAETVRPPLGQQARMGTITVCVDDLFRVIEELRPDLEDSAFPSILAAILGAVELPNIEDGRVQERVAAARYATEVLGGELALLQQENAAEWLDVLKDREQALLDRHYEAQLEAQKVLEDWRQHAGLVLQVQGKNESTQFAHPSRPILLADPDDVTISTISAAAIT